MRRSFLSINKLSHEPYSNVLVYPRGTKRQVDSRIKELKKLGIKSVSFEGELKLGPLKVLGKGYVGVVVLAKKGSNKVALKIRRIDSQRKEMKNEARNLKMANKAEVGPNLIDSSKNFLIMEYLDGEKISLWINRLKRKNNSKKIKSVIRKVLEDCYNLDKAGLDHGELSTISKHVIVGKKTTIIDFESASTKRRVSNVTSATQGILIGSGISNRIKKNYKIPPKSRIIKVLRQYKKEKSRTNFEQILEVLRV